MRKLFRVIIFLSFSVPALPLLAQTPLKMRDTTIKGPQTFAMVVGVSKYRYVRPLRFADKDAELFRDYLKSPGGGNLKEDNIFCLLNEQALNSTFWSKGFQWLKAKQLRKGDRLFIYLAGHGDAIDEDQFFFLTWDCNPGGDKNNYLAGGAIQLFNLKKKIANETTKGVEVFFIMDACRSNELPGGIAGLNFLNTAITEKKVGEVIMLATAAGEASLEDASIGNGHGLFTYYLVDGLSGLADLNGGPDQKVTFQEIQSYIGNNVPSIALQRFKRKQDPYFCCNENSEKVISTVDTAYLSKWLKQKKQQNRGGGNSFSGIRETCFYTGLADTALIETYNRFYAAVKNKNLTGQSSAEDYYEQLDKKFPGNPYTLDAKTTLAVEYINAAQTKVNLYLDCSDDPSTREKQSSYELGVNLEKAINILREDEPDFASSLAGRMYFLKSCGDFGSSGKNGSTGLSFQYAHAALATDPNGAYIQNKLALLHLENNRTDSALFYAEKAAKTAPNWLCALSTLALVKNTVSTQPGQNKQDDQSRKKPRVKNSIGAVAGSGISQLNPGYTDAPNSDVIGVNPRNILKLDLGIIYQAGIGPNISLRPTTLVSIEGGELIFDRRAPTGGPVFHDTVKLKNTSVSVSLPVIFHLPGKKIIPFISLGPTFNYIISQDASATERVPVKKSVILGDAGFGIDIPMGKSKLFLSPELRYTHGFNNQREDARTEYTNNLSSLKKRGITFSIYLRGR